MVVKVVRSDTPDKIKVDFSDRWSGYFLPHEVVKYNVFKCGKIKNGYT